MHGQRGESTVCRLLFGSLRGELSQVVDAVVGLNAGKPGEGDATGVETAASVDGTDLDDGALIEAQENVHLSGLGALTRSVYAVLGAFESILTAASIVIRSVRIRTRRRIVSRKRWNLISNP
jgi:hypothetical protein